MPAWDAGGKGTAIKKPRMRRIRCLWWTRRTHDITLHETFVPRESKGGHAPQPAVTLGSGAIWMQAYDAVTTKGGA
jgi:hypothetical protein